MEEWNKKAIDALTRCPECILEPMWRNIFKEPIPREFEEELKSEAMRCANTNSSKEGFVSCVIDEMLEIRGIRKEDLPKMLRWTEADYAEKAVKQLVKEKVKEIDKNIEHALYG